MLGKWKEFYPGVLLLVAEKKQQGFLLDEAVCAAVQVLGSNPAECRLQFVHGCVFLLAPGVELPEELEEILKHEEATKGEPVAA